jgi:hypothetical protein
VPQLTRVKVIHRNSIKVGIVHTVRIVLVLQRSIFYYQLMILKDPSSKYSTALEEVIVCRVRHTLDDTSGIETESTSTVFF